MRPIKLLILTSAITLSIGKFAYSQNSVKLLMCDTKFYASITKRNVSVLPRGTKYLHLRNYNYQLARVRVFTPYTKTGYIDRTDCTT